MRAISPLPRHHRPAFGQLSTINSELSTTSRLSAYALELDHWFAAETRLLQHVRARFCPQAPETPATPASPPRQPATVLHSSYSSHSSQPSAPAAPEQAAPEHPQAAGIAAAPPPIPPLPPGEGRGEGPPHNPTLPRTRNPLHPAAPSKLDTIADLLHTFTLNLLSALHPDPQTLRLLDRLLKRSLDFEKLRLRRDQRRRRPPRPRSTIFGDPAQDDEDDELAPGELSNSEKLALMRKLYFADVDELERSGRIKIPPPPDLNCGLWPTDPMDSFAYEI